MPDSSLNLIYPPIYPRYRLPHDLPHELRYRIAFQLCFFYLYVVASALFTYSTK